MASCDHCEYEGECIAYETDTDCVCARCWVNKPGIRKRIEARKTRWAKLGHNPGSDMCGCSMCAEKADRDDSDGEYGLWRDEQRQPR